MQPSILAKHGSILLFLAITGFYLYGLGHIPFVGPDEPRYAQISLEMLERRDLITPILGGHTWFEKPVLLYWLIISSFKLFGISEWSARLGPATCGLLTIGAVFWIGRRVERASSDEQLRGLGFWSALILATSLGLVVFSRGASFDIVITMTTAWALALFLVHEIKARSGTAQKKFLAGFYALVGLSLLAKGLVGVVIPFGVVGLYYVLRREQPARRILDSLLWGIPLTLAVSAIWYGPVIAKHGWPFIDQFFIQHHFVRYVTDKYHHHQPFYFYLFVIVPLTLPWTAFLVDGFMQIRKWRWRSDDPVNMLRVFTLAWVAMPLIFFSFSESKLPGYILPVLPAVALIAGERLARLTANYKIGKWALRATGAIWLFFAIGGLAFVVRSTSLPLRCALIIAVLLSLAACVVLLSMRRRSMSIIFMTCSLSLVYVIVLNCFITRLSERETSKSLIQLADARGYSQTVFYGLQRDDRTPEFYAPDRVVYGDDGEPILFEGPVQAFNESRKRQAAILVFVRLRDLNELTALKQIQSEVIGNNGKYGIVAIRAR